MIPYSNGRPPSFSMTARVVYGEYRMEDHKDKQLELMRELKNTYNLPFIITNDYPAHAGYELLFNGAFERWTLGTKIAVRTTGGRVQYRDYSGSYSVDRQLMITEVTEFIGLRVTNKLPFSSDLGLNIGFGQTKDEYSQVIELTDGDVNTYSNQYTTITGILGPESRSQFLISNKFLVQVMAAYDMQFYESHDVYVVSKPDWSGWRFGIGLGIQFE